MASQASEAVAIEAPKVSSYRWTIVALLFAATTINYMDRQVLGILAPTLQKEFGWSEAGYSNITMSFTLAYAIGFLFAGTLMDRIGVKRGYALAIIVWSCAAMSHALASTARGFAMARAALGLGESGNFPGAIRATADWFPRKERALATGIFNAGSNVGAIVAPLSVPFIALHYGWRLAFLGTGFLSFAWLLTWLYVYETPERHRKVSSEELAYIRSDAVESTEPVSWGAVLKHRQAWAFVIGKFLTDPVWWFYLFWLPKFLDKQFGVKLVGLAAPLVVIYVIADVGSIYGGYLSSAIIKRGSTVNRGRKTAMLIAACLIVPTMFAPQMSSMWGAAALVSLAAASHQWWSANLFTTASDMFPRRAVASMVGFGGFAGAMGGVLFQYIVGQILERDPTGYQPIFVLCGSIYVVALAIMHLIVPRLTPANLDA